MGSYLYYNIKYDTQLVVPQRTTATTSTVANMKISEKPKALTHSQSLCHVWLMALHHYVVTGHAPIALKHSKSWMIVDILYWKYYKTIENSPKKHLRRYES